ncbi:MAG: F0F1 ATP synthase subunit B [Hyphomicrobiaceae bacterium]|nr:F0F1 ATP synthase subunit B [Hyphomicrobiaceae bacterium]
MADLINNPEIWVLVSFLIFCGILVYAGVPGMLAKSLDERADRIKHELDEARRLREEAQALLADYQKKARLAEDEAREIIEQARREAEALEKDTEKKLSDSMARRMKLAEEKIARAEAQAVSEVRSSAVEAAIAATEHILRTKATGAKASALIDESIQGLAAKIN